MNDIDFYTSKSNTLPAKRMSVDYALRLIKEGKYREYADKVRNARTGEEMDRAKFDAPGFSFSGIFERRGKERLIRHSGIMAIDIDHLDGDVFSEKERLMKNPYVYSVFLSISGKGLKVLIKVPDSLDAESHKLYYRAIAEDFGVDEDRRAQDVARYTNVTYDPDLHLNPGALVWNKPIEVKEEMAIKGMSMIRPAISVNTVSGETRHLTSFSLTPPPTLRPVRLGIRSAMHTGIRGSGVRR